MILWIFLFIAFPAVADDQALPPRVLYHFGKKAYMLQNAELDNIPEEAWRGSVMGKAGRYGLMPFRRGMYGGERISSVEFYGNLYLDKEPWFMAFHIKDSCRRPERVSDLTVEDPKFVDWISKNIDKLLADFPMCISAGATSCEDLLDTSSVEFVTAKREENRCERLLAEFLTDYDIKVVRDGAWHESWYVRDRECIEKIDGNANEVLEMMADMDWMHESRGGGMPRGALGSALFTILFNALDDESHVRPELMDKLREKARGSDIKIYDWEWKDMKEKKGAQAWIADNVPLMLDAYQRCEKSGRRPAFRSVKDYYNGQIKREEFKFAGFKEFPVMIWDVAERLRAVCR